jgi:nucleoside-diphosphate-sugar epimerase
MTGLPEAVVLFGAGGFIGRNIVDALTGQVDRLIGVTAGGRPVPGCDLVVSADRLGDIPALPKDSLLINVAAMRYDPRRFRDDQSAILQRNVAILTAAYAFCVERGIGEVRQAGSSAVYPAAADPLDDEVPLDLNAPPHAGEMGYAWSRRMAEITADVHRELYGIQTQTFRLTNPFGAHDTLDDGAAHVATALVIRVLKEQGPLRLLGNPDAERDFVYAGDVGGVFRESCRCRGLHTAMNLARGQTTSIRRFAETVLAAAGSDRAILVSNEIPPGVNIRRATGRRLRQTFPHLDFHSLEDGVKDTIAWYRHAFAC